MADKPALIDFPGLFGREIESANCKASQKPVREGGEGRPDWRRALAVTGQIDSAYYCSDGLGELAS